MYQGYKLGIVVPAYNEEKLISGTLENMPRSADRIYVVNDGSTDNTRQIIEGFNGERFCILSNGQNCGVGAAITTGYKKALEENIDIVVVMAGDNQMDAKHLPELLKPIIKGKADYAKGNRLSRREHCRGMSNWRFFGNWVLTLLTRIASGYWGIRDSQNGYTAITRDALKRIDLDKVYPRYGYCNDLLVKLKVAGCRVADVIIPARYGKEKSKIKYRKYITRVPPLLLRGFLWRLRMKYLRTAAMNLDFTLNKYKQLCDAVRYYGYTSSTVADYLEKHNSGQEVIVLRHDVDRKPQRALQMAKLEHEVGIRSTYYFRFNRKVFQPHLIGEIANMGHEIGYHYETLDKTNGDYEKAIQMFEHELDEFRKIAEVKTVCMHGNPVTKYDNRDLWSKYDFRNFGLMGEAYLSFSNDITYLSDTGRTWEAKRKVKDWLPSAANNHAKKDGDIVVSSTDDITELIKKGQLGCAYLLVHPERWSNSLIGWTTNLVRDTGVNLAKRILRFRQRQSVYQESMITKGDNNSRRTSS